MITPLAVVEWLASQRVVPLPCLPQSKMPRDLISTERVYSYGEAPPDDSFHNPTPERLEIINKWWSQKEYHREAGPSDEAISIDCNPGYSSGRRVFGLDADDDALYEIVISCPELSLCPAVCGKKGVKLIGFISDGDRKDIPGMLQYYGEDPHHPVLELFTEGKHLLIYGEHPDSTPDKKIFYRLIRGFGEPIPEIPWGVLLAVTERLAESCRIVRSKTLIKTSCEEKPRVPYVKNPLSISNRLGIRLETVCTPLNAVVRGQNIYGGHPYHGSTTGLNFHIDVQNQRWYCHRCKIGGGVQAWSQIWMAHKSGVSDPNLCKKVLEGQS